MKHPIVKGIKNNALLLIAVIAFIFFESNKHPYQDDAAAAKCCSGYNITTGKLKQFMLDSLHGIQFEGGVYSKQKLLNALNKIAGDSVYLINTLLNCDVSNGADIAITSPNTNGVVWISKPGCTPCPGKVCCVQRVCVARINRQCINYKIFNGLASGLQDKNGEAVK